MKLPPATNALPVTHVLDEVNALLAENRCVVLEAPPGSGKTTLLPLSLMDAPWLDGKRVVMLEPRRLAAQSAAGYMAGLLHEKPGGRVGYHVRLDRKVSRDTTVEIVTEGLLAQRFLGDESLADTGVLIFDEFHERSLTGDQAFAMALEVRRVLSPDLRLVVMSATMDADAAAAHIGDAAIVRANGRQFPVETRWQDAAFATRGGVYSFNARAIAETLLRILRADHGNALVFLPGEGEIRSTAAALDDAGLPPELRVHTLFGAMPREKQDAALRAPPPGIRHLILATSIAETSLTIDGVRIVIDSGWMRVSKFSPRTGMGRLVTQRVTRDRADQRRGRAGRQFPGVCYRLWSEAQDTQLLPHALPEILEADLALLVLQSHAWGAPNRDSLPWITPPPEAAWQQAQSLLTDLGALHAGRLTPHGRRMSRLGLHPRFSHCLLVAEREHCHNAAALLAALVTELPAEKDWRGQTDARILYDHVAHDDGRRFPRIHRLARQWTRLFPDRPDDAETSPGRIMAWAFPDRIARRRGPGKFLLASGKGAELDTADPLARAEWLVVIEVSDGGGDAKIRLAAPLDWDEIADDVEPRITEENVVFWDDRESRLRMVRRRALGAIALKESETNDAAPEKIRAAMLAVLRQRGLRSLDWTDAATNLRARLHLAHTLDDTWPDTTDDAMLAELDEWFGDDLEHLTRWRDVAGLDLCHVMRRRLRGRDRELDALLPTHLDTPAGSHVRLRYDMALPHPVMSVKLQEVFGMPVTPTVARGRIPVTLELLSPAQRPIHVTQDLAHFWDNGYTHVRKEMRGRYPKHDWPEDPRHAAPRRNSLKRKKPEH